MGSDGGGPIGVGYEGRSIDEFVEDLMRQGVAVLADVRLHAVSRKRGFSKRKLEAAMADAGIQYVHLPQLGNPRENRAAYATYGTPEGARARATFGTVLESDGAKKALEELARLVDANRVAVMCFEFSELHCHRREVLAALRARTDHAIAV